MAKQYISDLQEGQAIDSIFVVRNKQIKQKKNGEHYLSLELVDKTGFLASNMWDNFDPNLLNNDYVKVQGVVGSFAGRLQGTIKNLKILTPLEVNIEDLLPSTPKDIETMYFDLQKTLGSIENKYLKQLLDVFFNDEEFVSMYKKAPAALGMHNAYIGGLLEHVMDLLTLGEFICSRYDSINKDLLITGIILHDAGKIYEYQYKSVIDFTDWGRLIGHNIIILQIINDKIKEVADFPEELKMQLDHLILSHHGKAEWGSPKQPMTLEAVVLHHLDNLESKVAGFQQFAEKNLQEGTNWTSKSFMFDNRHLYIPNKDQ